MLFFFSFTEIKPQCNTFDYPNDFTLTSANQNAFLTNVNNSIVSFGGDLIVDATVNSAVIYSATLKFDTDGDIILMAGASLTIDETTATSCDPDGIWNGIQVRGIPTLPYSPGTQGDLYLKSGTIINARVGVCNYNSDISTASTPQEAGGRIHSVDGQFTNCNQAVVLGTYSLNNGHFFQFTDFEWNDQINFTFAFEGFKPMFQIYDNTDVIINRCRFTNRNEDVFYPQTYNSRAAVYVRGQDGSIIMNGNGTGNISGFAYGIYMSQNALSQIIGVNFKNFRDIYMHNTRAPEVRSCAFDDLTPSQFQTLTNNVTTTSNNLSYNLTDAYGLYMRNCTDYTTALNVFRFTTSQYDDFGIIVSRSGEDNNLIESNSFSGCDAYAISSIEDNRELSGPDGLRLECNNFQASNFGDIYVHKYPGSAGSNGKGIASVQGEFNGAGFSSPGNTFGSIINDGIPNNGFHIYNVTGEVGNVTYYYHPSDNLQEADGDINPISNGVGLAGCNFQSNKSVLNKNDEILLEGYDLMALAELRDYYYALIQADEQSLIFSIDEVEIETLSNRVSYNKTRFNQVVNNAIAAISSASNAPPTLPETTLEEIQSYAMEHSREDVIEGILTFIEGKERLSDYYLLTQLYASVHNFDLSQVYLNSIADNFELSERQQQEHEDYLLCYEIRNNMRLSGNQELDEGDLGLLETISEKELNSASGMALGMLMEYGNYNELEYIPLKENLGKNMDQGNIEVTSDLKLPVSQISVYPNPAQDYIQLSSDIDLSGATYIIHDIHGKVVGTGIIIEGNKYSLAGIDYSSGLYNIEVKKNNVIIGNSKFHIK